MIRHIKPSLLLCICLLLTSTASLAQISAETGQPVTTLPAWTVLVLKPVGADRVRPITGVVVSGQGLIIVPFDFAAPGDQIIVLDGGTDIVANGRAATIRQQIPEAGLTLLSAPTLKRRPASLPLAPLAAGDEVRLAAFPPAELIAQGAAPVSETTRVRVAQTDAPDGGLFTTARALPNVTGPLLDRCGNLVGFSSAEGVQSMDTSRAPALLWTDDLLRVLQGLQLELMRAPCPESTLTAAQEVALPVPAKQAVQALADTPADDQQPVVSDDAALLHAAEQPRAGWRADWLAWLGVLALILLVGLLWRAFARRRASAPRLQSPDGDSLAPAKAEQPAGRPNGKVQQTDCVIEISGRLADGTPFISSCDVNGAAINMVIGRGRADISIDCEDVHREHARLSGSAEMLTISDLGSARGTWINRVPCMEGEIMFISTDDTIFLGDVSFQVSVRPRQDPVGNN